MLCRLLISRAKSRLRQRTTALSCDSKQQKPLIKTHFNLNILPNYNNLSLSADINRRSKLWAIPISFLALCLGFFIGPEMCRYERPGLLHRSRLHHGIVAMQRPPKERCKIIIYLLNKNSSTKSKLRNFF